MRQSASASEMDEISPSMTSRYKKGTTKAHAVTKAHTSHATK